VRAMRKEQSNPAIEKKRWAHRGSRRDNAQDDSADRLNLKPIARKSRAASGRRKRVRIVLAYSDPDDACVKRSVAAVLSPHAH